MKHVEGDNVCTSDLFLSSRELPPGEGGVLPHICYMGMCRAVWYAFSPFRSGVGFHFFDILSGIGYGFCLVWDRVGFGRCRSGISHAFCRYGNVSSISWKS